MATGFTNAFSPTKSSRPFWRHLPLPGPHPSSPRSPGLVAWDGNR
jgi:hypothetical protein